MKKKTILEISLALSAALIAVAIVWGILISRRTRDARAAAEEFVTLLQNAELERLRVEYYVGNETEGNVFVNESGLVSGRLISKQEAAEIFGTDVILELSELEEENAGDSDLEQIGAEELLELLMKHAQLADHVGTIIGKNGSMNLQMVMPDLKNWLLECPEEELETLNAIEGKEAFMAELDRRMESGEMGTCYVQLRIPMTKKNGRWRFEVTEEIEQKFFGGLYFF